MKKSYRTLFFLFIMTLLSCHLLIDESKVEDNVCWVKLKEGESIDGYTRSGNLIFGGYLDSLVYYPSMLKVDVQTFEVCIGSSYARDKKRVYYPIKIKCIDATTHGGCYYEEYVIKGAKPETFKYLHEGYAVDKNNMYHNGKKIKWQEWVLEK